MTKKRRVYLPRTVGGQVMLQADLERLYKYMLEIEGVDHISGRLPEFSKKPPALIMILRFLIAPCPQKAFHGRERMAQIYFHCSGTEGVLLDRRGSEVDDLIEARERAIGVVRTIMSRPGPEDWRRWILHVSDGDGEEIFALPFSSLIGELH